MNHARKRLGKAAFAFFVLALSCNSHAALKVFTVLPSGSTPETISPIPAGFGAYGGDYLVPDIGNNVTYIVDAATGTASVFANGVSGRGGLFVPTGYGALSGNFLLADTTDDSVKVVDATGSIIKDFAQSVTYGAPVVAPAGFGAAAGKILFGSYDTSIPSGLIKTIANDQSISIFAQTAVGVAAFGTIFAPTGFGSAGGDLLVSDGGSRNIYKVDAAGNSSIFATVPTGDLSFGLRQMAFAPASFGAYAGDLFLSVSGSTSGGGISGELVVLDGTGALVAVLQAGSAGMPFDPRGLFFTNDGQLLIADTDPGILVATAADFTAAVPEPATLWMLVVGLLAVAVAGRARHKCERLLDSTIVRR